MLKPKNKLVVLVSIAVIVLVLAISLYFFLQKNNLVSVNYRQNTSSSQIETIKQFSDTELGVSFSYPQTWGDIQKIITAHIKSEPFDLIHEFNFSQNPFVTISVNYIGEPNLFRQHDDYSTSILERTDPRGVFCKSELETGYDVPKNKNPGQLHSPFRRFGFHSFGVCDEKIISFITVNKVSDSGKSVNLDRQGSLKIEMSKTYVVEVGNQSYSPLKIAFKLPNLISNDYCDHDYDSSDKPPGSIKNFKCITYQDKEKIDRTLNDFNNGELNKEIIQFINSIFVESVAKQEAENFVENYFKTKSIYLNDNLGIKFSYPSILPVPILTQKNGTYITIDGFNIMEATSRQDATEEEKSAETASNSNECVHCFYNPSVTTSEWDLHLDMLTKNTIDKEKCEDCISITTIGSNKFLVTFQSGVGYTGYAGKRYITYQKGKRYVFNGFPKSTTLSIGFDLTELDKLGQESAMQKVIMDIIASVQFY